MRKFGGIGTPDDGAGAVNQLMTISRLQEGKGGAFRDRDFDCRWHQPLDNRRFNPADLSEIAVDFCQWNAQ